MNPPKGLNDIDPQFGRRLDEALTMDGEPIIRLLNDPSMDVVRSLLKNPLLDEGHLALLLRRRDLSEDVVAAVAGHPLAQESHNLKVALVQHPRIPMRLIPSLIPQLYLFELLAVCFLPGVHPDKRIAAERAIMLRLPAAPLGNKITLARRATPSVLEALLLEGDPAVISACLDNPHVKESSLFRLLNTSAADAETISAVARRPRWKNRGNLKLAILRNPKTPFIWFTVLLPAMPLVEVKNLYLSGRLTAEQKKCVLEELKRRGVR